MKQEKIFPLDLQLFAEGDGGNGTDGNQATPPPAQTSSTEFDYDKLADIVSKRNAGTEDSIIESYLKKQGLSGDDLQQAITAFKEDKAAKAKAKQDEYQGVLNENKILKEKALDGEITSCALGQGIPSEKAPFVLKLIDREGLAKEDGTTDAEKLKTAIEELLKVFPELKPNAQNPNGFQQIGASGNDQNNPNANIALASAFGNKN